MRKRLITVAVVFVAGAFCYPTLAHWRENRRRAQSFDLPQSQRALRRPTAQQLRNALPGTARDTFEGASSLTLYSLRPNAFDARTSEHLALLHDYPVLGRLALSGAQADALRASFYDGLVFVPRKDGLKQIGLGCFMPRHAIRATRNGHTLDLLICFGCGKFESFYDGKQGDAYPPMQSAPRETFNQFLIDAHVPLANS